MLERFEAGIQLVGTEVKSCRARSVQLQEGFVRIEKAKLRKQHTKERNRFTDYMLQFLDTSTMEYASCWQPLLLEFNDNELELT